MRVITTTGSRNVNLVLRYLQTVTTSYKVVIINDNTKAEAEIDVDNWTLTQLNDNMGQLQFTVTDAYNEGDELTVKVVSTDGLTVYHRNKIFVTDQTPQNYNING